MNVSKKHIGGGWGGGGGGGNLMHLLAELHPGERSRSLREEDVCVGPRT